MPAIHGIARRIFRSDVACLTAQSRPTIALRLRCAMRSTPASPDRLARYRRGRLSEWLAAALLIAKGYRILGRRVRTPHGEIDLVAVRGSRLAFVEVKRRLTRGEAEAALTPRQAGRIARAAEFWVSRHAGTASTSGGWTPCWWCRGGCRRTCRTPCTWLTHASRIRVDTARAKPFACSLSPSRRGPG